MDELERNPQQFTIGRAKINKEVITYYTSEQFMAEPQKSTSTLEYASRNSVSVSHKLHGIVGGVKQQKSR